MFLRIVLTAVALLASAISAEPPKEKRLVADRTFHTLRSQRPWAREARTRMVESRLRQRVRATATATTPTAPVETTAPPTNVETKPAETAP